MNRESVERLRFDRRLQRRLGWVDATVNATYLESLPDVSSKMTTIAAEEKASEDAITAPSKTSAPAALAGDFSKPSPFSTAGGAGSNGRFGSESAGS